MSLIDVFRNAVTPDTHTVCECRNCGEKLADDAETCANCGAREVVRYEF